jgi:diguanylate cyclase (GGDEF)-like protein
VQKAVEEGRVVALPGNCMLIRRDGLEFAIEGSAAPIHKHDGSVSGAVIVLRDAAQARAMTQRMLHLAQHDVLTGLPNRALLTERLVQAIGQARRRRKQVALLFLDLDYFKDINDSLGHLIGDQLLKSVAERLVSCVRTTDTVSRQGGDEFVILLSEIENPGDAANVAEKLRSAFASPHIVDGHELLVTLSLGVSVYPDDGTVPEVLMQNADTAMYQAKENGRNNYLFFKTEMCVHYGNGQGQLWSRSAL